MPSFTIGQSGGDHLTATVTGPKPGHRQYDWTDVRVTIRAGGFRGEFDANFMTYDFAALHAALEKLDRELVGPMHFQTAEEQLSFVITGDGRGHLTAECQAKDEAGAGNTLEFTIHFDQSYLPHILRDLEEIIESYPVQ